MGCVFCASGLDGVDRSLTKGEILEQMLRLQRLLPIEERLSHIVMMGMGEPLANLDNVLGSTRSCQVADRSGYQSATYYYQHRRLACIDRQVSCSCDAVSFSDQSACAQ